MKHVHLHTGVVQVLKSSSSSYLGHTLCSEAKYSFPKTLWYHFVHPLATYTWGCYIHVTLLSKQPLSDDPRQLNWEFALKGGLVSWTLIATIGINLMFHMAIAIIGKVTTVWWFQMMKQFLINHYQIHNGSKFYWNEICCIWESQK